MWTLREKTAPSKLRPALIAVNLQRTFTSEISPWHFPVYQLQIKLCNIQSLWVLALWKPLLPSSLPQQITSCSCQLLPAIPCLGSFPSKPLSQLWSFSFLGGEYQLSPEKLKPWELREVLGVGTVCLEQEPDLAQQNCRAAIKHKANSPKGAVEIKTTFCA